MNESRVVFQFGSTEDETVVRELLKTNGLPDEDIREHFKHFLLAKSGKDIVGCVGLEAYDDGVLLRSLAVAEPHRGQGIGKQLTDEILRLAGRLGATDVYLLTLTAEHFFEKFDFRRMPREEAPGAVRNSKEFTLLCPSTAVLMHRRMEEPT